MTYKTFKRTLTRLSICFGMLSFLTLVVGIGGGGVLNDLDIALIEIKDLEHRGLLDNPPPETSSLARQKIKNLGSSQAVEEYMKETGSFVGGVTFWLFSLTFLFFLMIIVRLFSKRIHSLIWKD